MTVQSTCIEKFRDKNNIIIGYRLQDKNGKCLDISSKELKNSIKLNRIHVDNLTLTSDDRLISTESDDVFKKIRQRVEADKQLSLYQSVLDYIGVELVGFTYLSIDKNFEITEKNILRAFRIGNANDIIVNGRLDISKLVGRLYTKNSYNSSELKNITVNNEDNKLGLVGRNDMNIAAIVLHSNGSYRLVMVAELASQDAIDIIASGIVCDATDRDLDVEKKFFITIGEDKMPKALNFGYRISEGEKRKLASALINSEVKNWKSAESAKNMIKYFAKLNSKTEAKGLLKSLGGGLAVGVPFAAAYILYSVVKENFNMHINMSADEQLVANEFGRVGAQLYKEAKKK